METNVTNTAFKTLLLPPLPALSFLWHFPTLAFLQFFLEKEEEVKINLRRSLKRTIIEEMGNKNMYSHKSREETISIGKECQEIHNATGRSIKTG